MPQGPSLDMSDPTHMPLERPRSLSLRLPRQIKKKKKETKRKISDRESWRKTQVAGAT
jgi:hypothetical protein